MTTATSKRPWSRTRRPPARSSNEKLSPTWASPNGNCPTASASSSNPPIFKTTRSSCLPSVPEATAWRPIRNTIPPRWRPNYVFNSGVGAFDLIQLQKKLSGILASVSPAIGERTEGVSGSRFAPGYRDAVSTDLSVFYGAPRRRKNLSIHDGATPGRRGQSRQQSPGRIFGRRPESPLSKPSPPSTAEPRSFWKV